ncbi:MAG: hypothetical protein ACHQFW_08530 [Chitinophagales bacterium]
MIRNFERTQRFPAVQAELWKFISSPANLSIITPPEMGIRMQTDMPGEIYSGLEINYTVAPIFNIRLRWTTLIEEVNAPYYFTDKQLKGPYAYWEHKHILTQINEGTEMRDVVKYKLPFGVMGQLAGNKFISNKIKEIFEFRRIKLIEIFGSLEL